jgi:hypothetical protein
MFLKNNMMKTKQVATLNASKTKVVHQYRINWSSVLVIILLLFTMSCAKSDDFETIDNSPPIADPGPNQTILLPTNIVNLDGSASTDLNNAIISYSWLKILGPDDYNFTNANAAQTQVTNLVEGVYLFQLTVTNALGLSARGEVSISVIQNSIAIYGSSIDINLMLPTDYVLLNNSPTGSSSDIAGMAWEKTSGPSNYNIAYSNLEYTTISDLVEGSYQFELTANYINGSVRKDTVNINLYDVSIIPQNAKEIIIENVSWTFPWYPTLEIKDFYNKISRESLFRIFVKRDGSTNWEDVPGMTMSGTLNNSYEYFIERRLPDGAGMYANGSLFIFYFGPTSDTPDIKIVYW